MPPATPPPSPRPNIRQRRLQVVAYTAGRAVVLATLLHPTLAQQVRSNLAPRTRTKHRTPALLRWCNALLRKGSWWLPWWGSLDGMQGVVASELAQPLRPWPRSGTCAVRRSHKDAIDGCMVRLATANSSARGHRGRPHPQPGAEGLGCLGDLTVAHGGRQHASPDQTQQSPPGSLRARRSRWQLAPRGAAGATVPGSGRRFRRR
jgi:hypothetical protein